jgi:hypothetical protein
MNDRVCANCGRSDGAGWVCRIDLATGKLGKAEHVACEAREQEKAVA